MNVIKIIGGAFFDGALGSNGGKLSDSAVNLLGDAVKDLSGWVGNLLGGGFGESIKELNNSIGDAVKDFGGFDQTFGTVKISSVDVNEFKVKTLTIDDIISNSGDSKAQGKTGDALFALPLTVKDIKPIIADIGTIKQDIGEGVKTVAQDLGEIKQKCCLKSNSVIGAAVSTINLKSVVSKSASGFAQAKEFKKLKTGKKAYAAIFRAAGKGIGKFGLKKVPVLGAIAGLGFGAMRLMKGDMLGAVGEVASGVAGSFPGIGTGISAVIDAGLSARDIYKDSKQEDKASAASGPFALQSQGFNYAYAGADGQSSFTISKKVFKDINRISKSYNHFSKSGKNIISGSKTVFTGVKKVFKGSVGDGLKDIFKGGSKIISGSKSVHKGYKTIIGGEASSKPFGSKSGKKRDSEKRAFSKFFPQKKSLVCAVNEIIANSMIVGEIQCAGQIRGKSSGSARGDSLIKEFKKLFKQFKKLKTGKKVDAAIKKFVGVAIEKGKALYGRSKRFVGKSVKSKPVKSAVNFAKSGLGKLKGFGGKVIKSKSAKTIWKFANKAFKPASKLFTKIGGKAGLKAAGKSALKKIPSVSLIAGLGFGAMRLMKGDMLGAVGEVASGVAGSFPGIGTGISAAIDVGLAARDIYKDSKKDNKTSDEFVPFALQPQGFNYAYAGTGGHGQSSLNSQTLAGALGQSTNINATFGDIIVNALNGSIDGESLKMQIEKVIKEINWANKQRGFADAY